MLTVSVSEAKDRLSELIALVQSGEEVMITRHGRAAAKIGKADDDDVAARRRDAFEKLAAMREKMRAEGRTTTVEEIIAWKNEDRP